MSGILFMPLQKVDDDGPPILKDHRADLDSFSREERKELEIVKVENDKNS